MGNGIYIWVVRDIFWKKIRNSLPYIEVECHNCCCILLNEAFFVVSASPGGARVPKGGNPRVVIQTQGSVAGEGHVAENTHRHPGNLYTPTHPPTHSLSTPSLILHPLTLTRCLHPVPFCCSLRRCVWNVRTRTGWTLRHNITRNDWPNCTQSLQSCHAKLTNSVLMSSPRRRWWPRSTLSPNSHTTTRMPQVRFVMIDWVTTMY